MTKPNLPATVANLDINVVIEVLSRNACNVSDAAADLGVPPSDLRRLMWANPQLQDQAFEIVEQRLDKAEKNIAEALYSDDLRRRDAASFFVLRNSVRAKRRGWITSAAAVDVNVGSDLPAARIVISWVGEEDSPDDSKLIEHEANPETSNKD